MGIALLCMSFRIGSCLPISEIDPSSSFPPSSFCSKVRRHCGRHSKRCARLCVASWRSCMSSGLANPPWRPYLPISRGQDTIVPETVKKAGTVIRSLPCGYWWCDWSGSRGVFSMTPAVCRHSLQRELRARSCDPSDVFAPFTVDGQHKAAEPHEHYGAWFRDGRHQHVKRVGVARGSGQHAAHREA